MGISNNRCLLFVTIVDLEHMLILTFNYVNFCCCTDGCSFINLEQVVGETDSLARIVHRPLPRLRVH